MLKKVFQKHLLLIFLLAFLLRLLWFFIVLLKNPQGFMLPDSWGYWRLAENLDEWGVFSMGSGHSLFPDSMRTPVYPLFIFLLKKAFLGVYGVVLVQIFISSTICVLTALLTEQITIRGEFSANDSGNEFQQNKGYRKARLAGITAGIIFALDFPSIFFANTVLTETLFTFLLLLAFCFFFTFIKNKQIIPFVLSAFFLGMAILCRPVAIFLPLVFAAMFFFDGDNYFRKEDKKVFQSHSSFFRNPFKRISLFLLISYLVIVPWFIRNQMVFGSPFLSTISEVNLLFHTAAGIRAKHEKRSLFDVQHEYKEISGKNFDWTKPAEVVCFAEYSRGETWRVIKENPVIFLENYVGSFFYFFIKPLRNYIDVQIGLSKKYESVSGVTDQRFESVFSNAVEKTTISALLIVCYQLFFILVLFFFSAVFLFFKIRNLNRIFVLMLLIIFYFALLSGITEVDARMRVPVIPFLCIIAGAGASLFISQKSQT